MRRAHLPRNFEITPDILRRALTAAARAADQVGGDAELIFERMEEIYARHGPDREAARKSRIAAILEGTR